MYIDSELKAAGWDKYCVDSRCGLGISYRFRFLNGYGAHVCDYRENVTTRIWNVRLVEYRKDDPGWWNYCKHRTKIPFETCGLTTEEMFDLLEKIKNLV